MRLFDNQIINKATNQSFDNVIENGNVIHPSTHQENSPNTPSSLTHNDIILEADNFVNGALKSISCEEQSEVLNLKDGIYTYQRVQPNNLNCKLHMEPDEKTRNSFEEIETVNCNGVSAKETHIEDELYSENTPPSSQKNVIIRGIINPNYPGFQRFAHTLTEHFMDFASSDYYDSDTSDQDIENCFEKVDANSNNYSDILSDSSDSNSNPVKRFAKEFKNNCLGLENVHSSEFIFHNNAVGTPDLLLKNTTAIPHVKSTNHPDLLYDVNRAFLFVEEGHKLKKTEHTFKKDDTLQSLTPVDIIGDFGEEVVRECGFLVTGYSNLKNNDTSNCINTQKLEDANLSDATDNIYQSKMLLTFGVPPCDSSYENGESNNEPNDTPIQNNCSNLSNLNQKTTTTKRKGLKFQKISHDDKQLPPIEIDYKLTQLNQRSSKKNNEKYLSTDKKSPRFYINNSNYQNKSRTSTIKDKVQGTKDYDISNEAEFNQYQDIVNNKELIIRNSRYIKSSSWAQYLENSSQDEIAKSSIMSPQALDLFDAYRIESDIDKETLKNHIIKAKEIEIKRRNDRDEIRRRLAFEAEPHLTRNRNDSENTKKISVQFSEVLAKSISSDVLSDTESPSSDSETCPKLSGKSINSTKTHNKKLKFDQREPPINVENYDFFTKQTKLQLETRMALAQSTKVAQIKMKVERRKRIASPITEIIRNALSDVGVYMGLNKHRVSRQMLTDMNALQLHTIVNELQIYIEKLNDTLVEYLFERDDLQSVQDAILFEIEEITKYIFNQSGLQNN